MATMQCVVDYVAFQNAENGFTVLQVHSKDSADRNTSKRRFGGFRAVGTFDFVEPGSSLELYGDWGRHPKFGKQFSVDYYTEIMPKRTAEIEEYLKSGHVRGIGKVYAKRIVEAFGEETWHILDYEPERLSEIKGINANTIEKVKKSWSENRRMQPLMTFLYNHGVSMTYAPKIFKEFREKSIDVLKENPYLLADRIDRIGFKKADDIALKMNFPLNSPLRIQSGIQYWLKQYSANTGSTYASRQEVVEGACGDRVLDIPDAYDLVNRNIDELLNNAKLKSITYREDECIYLRPLYVAEAGVADFIKLLNASPAKGAGNTTSVDVSHIEYQLGINYNEEQKKAIATAVDPLTKIMALTGGPGTGKTTVTQGIIAGLKYLHKKILLAAPTGRAAKRLTEATNTKDTDMEAKTIHRLLGFNGEVFQRDRSNQLEGDVLILDECSMIDIQLMHALLKAVPRNMKVIMIGDVDQLPSVGPGTVLRDVIESEQFPVVRLTQIFRQAQTSQIICGAHAINRGELPVMENGAENDLFFMARRNADDVVQTIVDLVDKRLPTSYNVTSHDIQVLTPKKKGPVGSMELNAALQKRINPTGRKLTRGETTFRVNDKVIQQENNYDHGVFNGDVGIVTSVNPNDHTLVVKFEDGKEVEYTSNRLDELSLAYAITIHKSQGSEYPIVVIPVMKEDQFMLERNLLYTGVTRAKKILILVGTRDAVAYAVKKVKFDERKSMLKEMLCSAC